MKSVVSIMRLPCNLSHSPSFLHCQHAGFERVVGVIEEDRGVDAAATEADLKVEVRRRGAARLSGKADDLTGLDLLSNFHEVLRLVTVTCRETVGMTDDDIVAVTVIRSRLDNDTVESCQHLIVGLRLDVDS